MKSQTTNQLCVMSWQTVLEFASSFGECEHPEPNKTKRKMTLAVWSRPTQAQKQGVARPSRTSVASTWTRELCWRNPKSIERIRLQMRNPVTRNVVRLRIYWERRRVFQKKLACRYHLWESRNSEIRKRFFELWFKKSKKHGQDYQHTTQCLVWMSFENCVLFLH